MAGPCHASQGFHLLGVLRNLLINYSKSVVASHTLDLLTFLHICVNLRKFAFFGRFSPPYSKFTHLLTHFFWHQPKQKNKHYNPGWVPQTPERHSLRLSAKAAPPWPSLSVLIRPTIVTAADGNTTHRPEEPQQPARLPFAWT